LQKKQKRSFTPTSDDGLVVPPVVDDDTPPPENPPLIRKAVAFSWNTATAPSNTYEATVTPTPPSHFLPGQAPSQPSPPPPPAPTKKPTPSKQKAGRKTRHFNDEFSSQTGRMRLKNYVNDVREPSAPPICHGSGPYSSMYRATSDTTTMSMLLGQSSPEAQTTSFAVKHTAGKKMKPNEVPSKSGPRRQKSEPNTTSHEPSSSGAPSPASGQYYRRDYDKDKRLSEQPSQAMSPSPQSIHGFSGADTRVSKIYNQPPADIPSSQNPDNHAKPHCNGVQSDSQESNDKGVLPSVKMFHCTFLSSVFVSCCENIST
jgi:hypothetical protein